MTTSPSLCTSKTELPCCSNVTSSPSGSEAVTVPTWVPTLVSSAAVKAWSDTSGGSLVACTLTVTFTRRLSVPSEIRTWKESVPEKLVGGV